jgi:hypothetical protein
MVFVILHHLQCYVTFLFLFVLGLSARKSYDGTMKIHARFLLVFNIAL